jgi:tetratricopeptide repeat protein
VTALLLVAALAAGAPASYADANVAYKQGRWADAAAGYEALLAAGIAHPDLDYNLGNAYFRDGRLGRAIYHYQRSLELAPGRDDAAHNLALARQLARERWSDRVEGAGRAPLWARVATAFSLRGLAWTFLVGDLVLFGCLVGRRLRPAGGGRRGLGWGVGVGATVTAVAGLLLAAHIWRVEGRDAGVVLDDEVGVRESADDHSVARVVIHGGLDVEITGRESGWLRIELPNRVEGWVPSTTIGEL